MNGYGQEVRATAKKRNCRRTRREKEQHETAVKIRKMTDEQICDFIDEIAQSDADEKASAKNGVEEFIGKLEELKGFGNGISTRTIAKLRKIAVEHGFMTEV